MTDEQIVELYWQRDEGAIEQTSQKYGNYLKKIANNILSDTEDSEECVNDTYLKAWNSMPTKKPSILSTFLGKIIRNLSIDTFRKRNSKKRYASEYALSLSEMEDVFPTEVSTECEVDANLLDKSINEFLRELPQEVRNVFVARYYYFDSLKDISKYCSISESKLKSLLYRTRQRLKEHLAKEGFEI